jgi:hypothetical protein
MVLKKLRFAWRPVQVATGMAVLVRHRVIADDSSHGRPIFDRLSSCLITVRGFDFCDAIFYMFRAFQSPGLMSRRHAQVLNMVLNKVWRFAASKAIKLAF